MIHMVIVFAADLIYLSVLGCCLAGPVPLIETAALDSHKSCNALADLFDAETAWTSVTYPQVPGAGGFVARSTERSSRLTKGKQDKLVVSWLASRIIQAEAGQGIGQRGALATLGSSEAADPDTDIAPNGDPIQRGPA